jgi:FixJ family two-component response regulator
MGDALRGCQGGGIKTVTIHIVEDDPGVGDSLALLLGEIGHQVEVYPDAESFFEHVPPGPQDTVIVDLGLPGVSGVQLIRWVVRLSTPPRVIAITGQSRRAITELFGDDLQPVLLRKPLTEEALVALL